MLFRSDGLIVHLENSGNQLLMAYREANQAAREKRAPQHFGDRWRLEAGTNVEESDLAPVSDTEIKTLVTTTTQTLNEAIENVHAALQGAITQYELIEQMTAKEFTHGAQKGQAA